MDYCEYCEELIDEDRSQRIIGRLFDYFLCPDCFTLNRIDEKPLIDELEFVGSYR